MTQMNLSTTQTPVHRPREQTGCCQGGGGWGEGRTGSLALTGRHHLPGNPQKPHIGAELPVLVGPKLFYLGIKKILWVYLCNPRIVLIAFFFPPPE